MALHNQTCDAAVCLNNKVHELSSVNLAKNTLEGSVLCKSLKWASFIGCIVV